MGMVSRYVGHPRRLEYPMNRPQLVLLGLQIIAVAHCYRMMKFAVEAMEAEGERVFPTQYMLPIKVPWLRPI